MSGILDNKSRVLDTIVTLSGRKQISSGKLQIKYVSFTDVLTHYQADLISGSVDATTRIYLEQCSLPQDQITLEADDSGRIQPFNNDMDVTVKDGQFISYSFDAPTSLVLTGSGQSSYLLRGEEFASTAGLLLESSLQNFNKLRSIGTKDKLFEEDGFGFGNSNVEFVISNERPINNPSRFAANINHLESLFNDVRFSNVENFMFLPPVNKQSDSTPKQQSTAAGNSATRNFLQDHRQTSHIQLGHYKPWGRTHILGLTPNQLEHELLHFSRIGFSKKISIDPTSRNNNIIGQFFEINHHIMNKLDVIKFEKYVWNGSVKNAFFIGKVMVDENNNHTFIHLFTLVFG